VRPSSSSTNSEKVQHPGGGSSRRHQQHQQQHQQLQQHQQYEKGCKKNDLQTLRLYKFILDLLFADVGGGVYESPPAGLLLQDGSVVVGSSSPLISSSDQHQLETSVASAARTLPTAPKHKTAKGSRRPDNNSAAMQTMPVRTALSHEAFSSIALVRSFLSEII
jgi:hypothetical protein